VDPWMMQARVRALLAAVATSGPDPVTISIGAVSIVPPHELASGEALATADHLLYEAKDAGRDRGVHLDLSTNTKVQILRSR